jgi:hypothetical protein
VAGQGVPAGGTTAQVLTKINATDYNSNWQTPATGLALPLGQTLTFAPDATFDIGAAAASRPRDLFLSRNAVIGGTLTLSADPSLALQAATKQYADTKITQAQGDARYQTPAQAAALYLPLAGGTLAGNLLFSTDNTRDIGAVAATRPRTIYAATSFIGPGAVPTGGTTNQVLGKTSATDYAVSWQTPSGGLTLPLTQTLTFSPDNSFDIGASAASRPRDLFLGRNLTVAGTALLTGNVGVGGISLSGTGLNVASAALTGTAQVGVSAAPVFTSAATSLGSALDAKLTTAAAAFTMASGYALRVPAPTLGAGSSVTTMYGVNIANQGGAGRTTAYGLFIAAQSGAATDNYALYAASQSWFEKGLGIGSDNFGNPLVNTYLLFNTAVPSTLTGTSQYGIRFGTLSWAAPTATAAVISTVGGVQLGGAAATLTNHYHLQLGGTIPNGWAITNAYGINVANQGATGVVNAYGLYIANQSGASTTNVGIRNLGTSVLEGQISIGTGGGLIRMPASDTLSLSIEAQKYGQIGGKLGAHLMGNAYFDGAGWQRYDVAQPSSLVEAFNTGITFYTALAGANPITWTNRMGMSSAGVLTLPIGSIFNFAANQAPGNFGGNGSSTTSAALVDVAGMSCTIVGTGGYYMVWADFSVSASVAGAVATFYIVMDGANIFSKRFHLANANFIVPVAIHGIWPSGTIGSHTFKLQFAVSSGTLNIDSGSTAVIYAVEIKR